MNVSLPSEPSTDDDFNLFIEGDGEPDPEVWVQMNGGWYHRLLQILRLRSRGRAYMRRVPWHPSA